MATEIVDVLLRARMEASGVEAGVGQIQKSLKGLTLPKGVTAELEKSFGKLTPLLKEYQKQLNKGFSNKKDLQNFNALKDKISETFGEIRSQVQSVNSQNVRLKVDTQEIDKLENKITAKSADLQKALDNVFTKSVNSSNITEQLNKVIENTSKASTIKPMADMAKQLFNTQDYAAYNNKIDELRNKILSLKTTKTDLATALGVKDAEHNLDAVNKKIETFFNNLKVNEGKVQTIEHLKQELKDLGINLENIKLESLGRGTGELQDIDSLISQLSSSLRETGEAASEAGGGMVRMVDEVNQLKSSTQYFFSLRNMINLLKRGIDEAVQSVKDLDKAMTETAVVTDYKVSDLWGMLPEYTKVANQLGATAQGAYETMTLYYQQGLEQQQAFELGAETMKMARIAGLDYAETTDMMTAALRGFNMELNETSAKRVNDVYSELAAITASDTEELGTAMQRTASIAASAGASFEGTTAFLAQAIETTREPAENIGTAMKTIVARFQEMKKNPLEISEVDGEEVDYNKIDAALKTIGVDLKDTNGQFRNFDEVMLDISAKWDTLSQSQQRYIATTAAGSRQQSRFIAMVSNYERTMQLMEAANNSAGASDEQFGKTMDSLESKLNQLHNAWQQFTMGIANNGMIKMAVDGLTGFLNITNKIIDTLSLGSGALKSFLSIFAAFTGLKMAGRGANALIGGLGGLVDPKSSVKEGLKTGLFGQGKNVAQAKAITTPIVGSLSKISGQIAAIAKRQGIKDAGQKGSTAGVKETSKEDYANTKRLFSQLSGKEGFKMGDTSNLFGKLDEKHQLSMFNNNPGTKQAMKQASMNWFSGLGLSKVLEKEGKGYISSIYKGMQQGQIPVDKGVELIGKPQKWGQYFGTEAAQAYSKSFIKESIPAMEESTQIAHEAAMYSLGLDPNDYKVGSDEIKQLFKDNKQLKEDYAALYGDFRKDIEKSTGHGGAKGTVSDMGRFANDIGAVADKFTQAGYGISAFGNALSQLGGPLGMVGNGIAAFGGAISTIGASISGATGIISLFTVGITDATGAVVVAGSTIAAVAAPLAALAVGFLLVRHHIKQVKEAGAEVTETFKETSKAAEDNIAKLKSYQGEFAQLSKGVDSNGYNVSLDDSQYQRYLEIVDDIAAINPEIVEGYNAQGHAIINNNKALAETLKTQQEIRDEAYKTYTEKGSLQKLINARNISSEYRNSIVNPTSSKAEDAGLINNKKTPFAADVRSIADLLSLSVGVKDFDFTKYGIDSLDALKNGEEKAVQNFVKHRQQIETDLSNSGIKLSDAVIKGFNTLGDNASAFDEAIKPVYDNLLANVSNSSVFESIAPEFREALNMGLKDLASQDLSAGEMSKAANNMAAKFANLTTGSGKYKDALEIVEQAQSNFANTLNETEYRADVEPAIQDLIKLKEEALDEGTAYGDALAEYLENQIQRISNFTSEGGANLTEALNTATDEIAAAEGALDSFNEATKKDFSTAAEGMKGIFDKTTETFKDSYGTEIQKHAEGMGDATFWTGAEALLSGKEIERLTNGKNGYDAAEAVAKKIKDLEPMLREGQEGFDAFTDRVLANADAMDKLAEAGVTYDKESGLITNIPDDQWHNVAEALGISDDLLTSMLNKGRQFADISFMNIDEARKALAASDFTIKGTSAGPGEQQNLYVKEDTLRTQLSEAGYVRREQQDEQIAKLLNEGVKTIPADATQLSSKELDTMAKDWGINTLPDLIQTLNETGDFTKDEIKNYADQMGLLGSDAQYDSLYSDIIEAAENPELIKQTGVLETISAQVAALADTRTGAEAKADYDKAHKELVGKNGIDTQAQAFTKGQKLDENGKLVNLTAGEFEQTKASMQEVANSFRETAAIAAEHVKTTTGTEQDYWKQVQKGAEADAARTDKYIQMADQAMKKRADAEIQEAEGRAKEVEARNKAREEEQARLMTEQHEKRGEQQESYWRERGKQENQVAQVADIQNKADYLLRTSINTSLKTALDNLDPTQIASDPAQSQAFSNLYADLINNRLPKAEDLQTLGIFTQLDSQYQDQINGVTEKASVLGEKLASAYKAFAETDKAALAMDVTPGADNIEKAISSIKERLKSWQNKINNTSVDTSVSAPKVASNISSGANAVAKIAQTATEQVQSKVTVDTSDGEAKLSNLKTKTEEVASTIQQGATFAVKVNDNGLKNAAKRAETITKASGSKNINVTASGAEDTNKLSAAVKGFAKLSNKTVSLTARASGLSGVQSLTSAVQAFHRLSNKTIRLTTIKETINKQAVGSHNHGYASSLPNMGSMARGSYGQIGPKGKGGLTLTGELGYEIAWLPDENRSMILGADGPQMINLPGNAVVWTHEQSKKILKQKSILAGSHASEMASSYKKKYITSSLGSSSGNSNSSGSKSSGSKNSSSNSSKSSSSNTNNDTTNHFSIEEVIRFDYDKTLETLASKIKKTTDQIEKNLNKIGTTAKDIAQLSQTQIKNLEATKKYNESLVASYQKDLNKLDKTSYKITVSYDTGSGKNKKSKEYTLDAQWYIYQSTDGQYQINQNAISKLGPKALQEAAFKALESALNPLASGLIKAKDAAYDAQKQIDDFNKKIIDSFYLWKNEITEIYDLSQRIAAQSAMQDRFSSQVALELARLNTGFEQTAQSIAIITQVNTRNNQSLVEQIKNQKSMIEARERELNAFTTGIDEIERLMAFKNMSVGTGVNQFATQAIKDAAIAAAEQQLKAVELARSYFVGGAPTKNKDGSLTYEIDWERFNADALGGKISEETAKSIKEFFDNLNTANVDYNNAIKENTELIKSTYDKLKEYQDYIVNFEDTLLHQLEEQAKEEINNAKESSESISNTLKDLFDEVKRRLNERRQQEDNIKTETDISQKQQRLAALQADTSGGHQVEIAQLQKEIVDSQQSYQRTLEDQLLEKLQQQNDEAARQRERQIELAQAQLDISSSTNKELVTMWLKDPTKYRAEIKNAWIEAQDYESKGLLAQQQLNNTFESSFAELTQAVIESEFGEAKLIEALKTNTIIDSIQSLGDSISSQQNLDKDFNQQVIASFDNLFKSFEGQKTALEDVIYHNIRDNAKSTITDLVTSLEKPSTQKTDGIIDKALVEKWKKGNITREQALQAGADKNIVNEVYGAEKKQEIKPVSTPTPALKPAPAKPKGPSKISEVGPNLKPGDCNSNVKLLQTALNRLGYKGANGKKLDVDGYFGPNTKYAVKNFQNNNPGIKADYIVGPATKKAFKKKGYKTGGLADYTGPAWLDGTPSKPELVLNATDTRNFLALRDVLSSAMKSTSTVSNSYGGDVMYDINIHVDKIEKDYDVDRVVDKVKKEITKGAGYRNVTQVRNFR